ncbi:hypothetical protein V6N13_017006 [Hibiscus sabdariffa]
MSNLTCNLFFLVLLIFSVGLRMDQVQGQEACHAQIPGDGTCDTATCSTRCSKFYPGSLGSCFQTSTTTFACQCTWPCT